MNRQGQSTGDEEAARWRRRTHAEIEGMVNLILDGIAKQTGVLCPPRVRTYYSALQSAHGGGDVARKPFARAHLTVAQYLQFEGSDVAREARVRRLLGQVEEYQGRCGFVLVEVTRGGGEEQRKTTYIDYLIPTAEEAMTRARASETWKRHPGEAKAEQIAWALEQLPRANPKGGSGKAEMELRDYAESQRGRIESSARKVAEKIEEKGGAGSTWLRALAKQLLKDASELELVNKGDAAGTVTDLLPSGDVATVTEVLPSEDGDAAKTQEKPDMFAAASGLAARGFRVFPVWRLKEDGACACPKGAKCASPGKHPRVSEWQKLASTDPGWLKGWFKRQWPGANVGIVTGGESRLCVVDVDLKAGGDTSLMELCERHALTWPDTLTVLTGSGGFHYYFTLPEGQSLRNTSGKLGPGIDTRCDGGLVVAPPSLHASGNRYEWVNDLEPVPLPDSLVKLLTEDKPSTTLPPGKARPQARSGAVIGAVIPFHERNVTLTRIAGALRGKGAGLSQLEAELLDINARRCAPPLEEDEVRGIARSVSRYPTEAEKRATVRA